MEYFRRVNRVDHLFYSLLESFSSVGQFLGATVITEIDSH